MAQYKDQLIKYELFFNSKTPNEKTTITTDIVVELMKTVTNIYDDIVTDYICRDHKDITNYQKLLCNI